MKFLAVLLALALPPVIYFPALGDRREAEIGKESDTIRQLDVKIEQARAARRKLDQFHAELARLDAENAKLRAILPPAMNIEEVRSMTEAQAAAHGVTLSAFEFNGKTVRASATGSASGLTEFFRDVSNAPRIIDVDYVTLHPDAAGWRTDFVMTSYALAD
jgi:Tfp pilus assembly protein PilO